MTDRRTVAKGVAWTLPVLTIAAAAPSLAASGSPTPTPAGWADKCPGASDVPGGWPKQGYRLVLSNVEGTPVIAHIEQGNGKTPDVVQGPTPLGGKTWEWVIDAKSSPSTLIVTLVGHMPATIKTHPHCK